MTPPWVYLLVLVRVMVAHFFMNKYMYSDDQCVRPAMGPPPDGVVRVYLEACFASLPVGGGTAGKDKKGGEVEGEGEGEGDK